MGSHQGRGQHDGMANGTHLGAQSTEQPPIARPFTLQEALPYSPHSSVIPFTSGLSFLRFTFCLVPLTSCSLPCNVDLIPDPTIGSGLPATSLASLFNSADFENLNKQASAPHDSSNKYFKHAVEQVFQELRPNQRTF